MTLHYPRLRGPVRLVGYCDAAWENLNNGKTGGGVLICFTDSDGRNGGETFGPISWLAGRLKRVVRSTFASETLIASETVDELLHLSETWQEITGEKVHGFLRTESRSLYDHIYWKGSCHEKSLVVELSVIREAVEEGLVMEVQWVETKVQLADALTKKMVPHALLRALQTSRLP